MSHQYQVTLFRAEQQQKLRNVRIHSPSIIQIIKGSKRLFWKDEAFDILHPNIMLCEANASLNFENLPQQGRFLSRMFSFHCVPSDDMLELSMSNALGEHVPAVETDKALQATLNALFSFEQESLSEATQRYWVLGLYQQLAERGLLHRLFTSSNTSFSEKLSRYLSRSPGDDHPLERVAERFAMSRATLIRKLKQEGTQYREVLAEVRLNHALYLMQNGSYNVALLAQLCGYQSEGRFSQRFKGKFGLTPSEYIKTVAS
ncbi:TPA: helix-turn-helix transcriptional regulator [Vibrio parahaemolyticus]|uniref:helix-turn-helix transcriptional regulator n=1 Tax=Vibrio parahaemolyticus TaxID=670 RepID=UPI0003F915AE|nr:helix-turn-helix transcriptional regulator [Vibrio parahaemolyticus]EGU0167138.1 helix-turn-helix transcriptional regulator [Vibrio parahaemolyticus]EGU0169127.1 helix-turn-helix transcriptional regulator [Vibrio parahaemolyticus]EHH1259172.1 helix-turn-helix transcriptional regulator [Vibrio parahaemolyticus]EHH2568617.1 helix-turn-helix transcriptional regulator [Vibrio parahaemolyticus]EJE8524719.1 helix-turn-helix transcriptional regulator [Vibrio parahaemolyticus]